MSITLRILLLAVSLICSGSMLSSIRRSRLKIEDSVFWFLFSLVLVVLSIFPGIVIRCAELAGVESPANFVFLIIIFVLLVRLFRMTVRISTLENKLQTLAQSVALKEHEKE